MSLNKVVYAVDTMDILNFALCLPNIEDINADQDKLGMPLLHYVAMNGDASMVDLLINNGADIEVEASQQRALHLAHYNRNHPDAVQCLVEHGASVLASNSSLWTPLHFSCTLEDPNMVKLMLEKGADVNAKTDEMQTALHIACMYDDVTTLRVLLDYGAKIEEKDEEGKTPFYTACQNNSTDVVKILIEAGASLNEMDTNGCTVLQRTIYDQHEELSRILIEAGANPNVRNK